MKILKNLEKSVNPGQNIIVVSTHAKTSPFYLSMLLHELQHQFHTYDMYNCYTVIIAVATSPSTIESCAPFHVGLFMIFLIRADQPQLMMNRSGDSETSQYLLMNGDRHFANVYLEVISSRIWHVLILDVDKHDICNRHHAGQRKSFESPTLISIVNDHKKWRFSHS